MNRRPGQKALRASVWGSIGLASLKANVGRKLDKLTFNTPVPIRERQRREAGIPTEGRAEAEVRLHNLYRAIQAELKKGGG